MQNATILRTVIYGLAIVFSLVSTSCKKESIRDHIWVVDQSGKETSLEGSWKVIQQGHPNSPNPIGTIWTLPNNPPFPAFHEGSYLDPDGHYWTKVRVSLPNGLEAYLLERVDTETKPDRLFAMLHTDSAGIQALGYSLHPYVLPEDDLAVFEKQK